MRDNIQKIEIDWEKKYIKCGDLFKHRMYVMNINWRYISNMCGYSVSNRIMIRRSSKGKAYYQKASGSEKINKKISEMLGMPPKRYAKILKGFQYELWIKGKEDIIGRYGIKHGKRDAERIYIINKNIDTIKQYQADGLNNILPYAVFLGLSTKDMKQMLGKSLWKSLCKNSHYRNYLLASKFNVRTNTFAIKDYVKESMIYLSKLSTTCLEYIGKLHVSYDEYLLHPYYVLKKERRMSHANDFERLYHLAYDTHKMAKQLGSPFKLTWSRNKMRQKHNQYTKEIQTQRFSDEPIECLKDIPVKELTAYGHTAKLLMSKRAIHEQGKDQGHCVGSYAGEVAAGKYLVYNICNEDGVTVSTLGIHRRDTKISTEGIFGDYAIEKLDKECFVISQHYMKYNESIYNYPLSRENSNPLEKIQDLILDKLNK